MINRNKILSLSFSALIAVNIMTIAPKLAFADETDAYKNINPQELVANPQSYMNNKIKFTATFDKFSALGLDYKPAFKDSKDHISFLIRRQDTSESVIPLSELKLIVLRDKAEKLADLESGDQIEVTGNVFSTALNDPWVDVENIKVLSSKAKKVSDDKTTDKPDAIKPAEPKKKSVQPVKKTPVQKNKK